MYFISAIATSYFQVKVLNYVKPKLNLKQNKTTYNLYIYKKNKKITKHTTKYKKWNKNENRKYKNMNW